MLYTEWTSSVLNAAKQTESSARVRLVGAPIPALRHPLHIGEADIDAIGDAVYDLEVLGLARSRANDFFNLTPEGRQAAGKSITSVCGELIQGVCSALTDDERRFLHALTEQSEREHDGFARLHFVNVEPIFQQIGLVVSRAEEETFLVGLVERSCIEYQEDEGSRDARPLFIAVACVQTSSAQATQ